jgi:hypothetical protein
MAARERPLVVEWQRSVMRSELPPTARLVCLALATRMDKDGRDAWPGLEKLALDTGLGQRTVARWLGRLQRDGWLHAKRQRRFRARYSARLPLSVFFRVIADLMQEVPPTAFLANQEVPPTAVVSNQEVPSVNQEVPSVNQEVPLVAQGGSQEGGSQEGGLQVHRDSRVSDGPYLIVDNEGEELTDQTFANPDAAEAYVNANRDSLNGSLFITNQEQVDRFGKFRQSGVNPAVTEAAA